MRLETPYLKQDRIPLMLSIVVVVDVEVVVNVVVVDDVVVDDVVEVTVDFDGVSI